jgi:hypothetical protein
MNGLILTTQRAVRIFEDMVDCRGTVCLDDQFLKMTDVWKDLCDESGEWKIKFYRGGPKDLDRPQAAVTEFNNRVRLTVSEELWDEADGGDGVANFILAHEIGHIELRHTARFATRHFQMAPSANGDEILPKSYFEKEADFAAVAFRCGSSLLDRSLSAAELSRLAFSDLKQVEKAQRMVQSKVFMAELNRSRAATANPRVVL